MDAEDDGLCWCGAGDAHDFVPGICRDDRAPDSVHLASMDAGEEQSDAVQDSSSRAEGEAQPSKLFGGMGAAEAARRRWEQARAREADAELTAVHEARNDTRIVRVPVQVGAIITRLATDAKKGNVQAARELRAYLAEVVTEDDTSISALDQRTRQSMKARLLAEIAAEQGEQVDDAEPVDEPVSVSHATPPPPRASESRDAVATGPS